MLVVLFSVSVGLNYLWELAQSPLYTGMPAYPSLWWRCFLAGVGDGAMIAIIQTVGWLCTGRAHWFAKPGKKEYALMLGAGFILALVTEMIAVHVLRRWSYSPTMPLVPALDVGLVPLAQMLVLPPIAFWLTARALQLRKEADPMDRSSAPACK